VKPSCDAERKHEARAHGLHIKGGGDRRAQLVLDHGRAGGKRQVGRGGGDHDQVEVGGRPAGGGQRLARRLHGEIAGALVGGGAVADADAGALDDPLVRRVDQLADLGVGDALGGEIAADAGDGGT
jgi:hypothetical protein